MKYFGDIPKAVLESRATKNSSKPPVLEQAAAVLVNKLKLEPNGNFLWKCGRWVPASLNDIMRAANRELEAQGEPQITNNPAWVVKYGE